MGKMLSVEQVAKQANVHIESVRRWIRQGKLPASLPSRYHGYQVAKNDLQTFLNNKGKTRQKGMVEAEIVLKSLAREWNGYDKGYIRVAWETAREAGILEDFQKEWDTWDGDLVSKNADLLHNRLAYRDTWGDIKKVKETEGKLILAEYNNTT